MGGTVFSPANFGYYQGYYSIVPRPLPAAILKWADFKMAAGNGLGTTTLDVPPFCAPGAYWDGLASQTKDGLAAV